MYGSDKIASWLEYLDNVNVAYKQAMEDINTYEQQQQDIEHKLELCELGYHEMAKLGKLLKEVRQKRRLAKDTVALLGPMVAWINGQKPAINKLKDALGDVRKVEHKMNTRFYTPRTDVVDFPEQHITQKEEN